MEKLKKTFHLLSLMQHPFGFAAMAYYVIFMISLVKGAADWNVMNNILLLVGISMSFATLQDTSKVKGKISKKIWSNRKLGTIALILIAILAIMFIATPLDKMKKKRKIGRSLSRPKPKTCRHLRF
jgi:hypothetical protein